MFLSYPIRPLSVSLWTLFVTSTQSLTCPFRPQMEPDQDNQPTEMTPSQVLNTIFLEEKTAPVTVQAQLTKVEYFVTEQPKFTEEEMDPVIFAQQEMEEGSVTLS